MRKIESKMLQAVKDKRNWQGANTWVFYETAGNPYGPRSGIYLHGNHIADYWHKSGELEINIRTLKAWPSNTTLSRLRALGANVYRKNNKVYLNNEEI